MRNYNKLNEIRFSEITPRGWQREFLNAEKNGMPGNLHKIGYPFDTNCWQYKSMASGGWEEWWPYEQNGYWIDSLVRTWALLDDDEIYDIVKPSIEGALGGDDWFIGPEELKAHSTYNRWPMAVFFRALYALWSKTGNEKILEKMRTHYLNDDDSYTGHRDIVNVESKLRLYEHFHDERLLEKAKKAYEMFDCSEENQSNASSMLTDKKPYQHGVSYNEQAKLAAIMYTYTGEKRYLDAAVNGYRKLDIYHMLADGVHSSSEYTYGNETKQAHESCVISDYTWSMGYLLEATGDSRYADKIEKACFNALMGAISPYFKAIQYFSTVNQAICARNSTTIDDFANTPKMAYQPHHFPECCIGNIGRAMPNYVLRMYQRTERGIAVSLYGDSVFCGAEMKITQSGNYPFGDTVTLKTELKYKNKNELRLRIPAWAAEYSISVNGKPVNAKTDKGYAVLCIGENDEITLSFKKEFSANESPDGGVYFTYGPFLMSLKIDEDIQIDRLEKRQTREFPAYNIYPKSKWNYAVTENVNPIVKLKKTGKNPFWEEPPIEAEIDAYVLNKWELERVKLSDVQRGTEGADKDDLDKINAAISDSELIRTPLLPQDSFIKANTGEKKRVTLIPYGCTNLRLTVFPKISIEERDTVK